MIFTQIEFLIFLSILLVSLKVLSNSKHKKVLLLFSSYYFYAYWDYRFLSLILISTLIDYHIGAVLSMTGDKRKRRLLLIGSLSSNMGILFFFKYFNFFLHSFETVFLSLGLNPVHLNIILPIGISFYTFQTLSYTIDIYRGEMSPCKSLLDFSIFVSFFPQLVAGPIVRASAFLPQLKSDQSITGQNFVTGSRQFVLGLFKKVFIADRIALFVDPVFADYSVYDSQTLWLAVTAYSIQIYCDFSGYSDMAIGTAKMIGYDLNINFNYPYLARTISDFWRRWHISLSTWIRDYLYFGLGGSRKGNGRAFLNLMVAMFLCGLWHGAGWTFIFWGVFHGIALGVYRLFRSIPVTVPLVLSRILTLLTVMVGWVFFRSQSVEQAFSILKRMILPTQGINWLHPFIIFIIAATILFHFGMAFDSKIRKILQLHEQSWYTPGILFCLIWLVIVFYPSAFQPFIYFQF